MPTIVAATVDSARSRQALLQLLALGGLDLKLAPEALFLVLGISAKARLQRPKSRLKTLLIGRDAGHLLADRQRVDIVSSLISFHRFEVAHVPEDRIFVGDAIGSQ